MIGWRRWAGVLAGSTALAVGIAACGGSDSDSSSSSSGSTSGSSGASAAATTSSGDKGVAYAKAQVAKFTGLPKFTFDGAPFDMSKIKGKKIFSIPIDSRNPFVASYDAAAKIVAEKYGATWTEFANQGQPNQWSQGIAEAVSQKADVIALSGPDVQLMEGPLKIAKKAGLKVIVGHVIQNGEAVDERLAPLVDGYTNAPFHEAARLEADYVTAQSGGKANVLIVTSNEVPPSKGIVTTMQDEYTKYCPGCKVSVVNVPAADWSTKIAPEVQSFLQKEPDTDWVTPIYDSMSLYGEAGIRSAGKQASVKIASFNGTPQILKLIEDGDITQMDVGESTTWIGWALMDSIGRALTGADPIVGGDEKLAMRIFTDDNIKETGTPPDGTKGYGTAYQAGYEKIWSGGAAQ